MTKYVHGIYDRTALDITDRTAKAFLNVADWVRIYGNSQTVNALAEFLLGIDITFNAIGTPTITSIPAVADVNKLIGNIEAIRLVCNLPAITGLVELKDDWVAGSSQVAPDYEDVNDWERVLSIINNYMGFAMEYRVYCGVAAVGQPRFWQNRFRVYQGWILPAASPTRRARTNVAICGAGLTRNNFFRRYT